MMNSRNILNIALVAIMVALFVVIVYGPGSEPEKVQSLLPATKLQAISRLQRWHNDELTLAAQKHKQGWKITSPFSADASDFQITSLLAITQQQSLAMIDPQQHELKKFGLHQPAYRLELDDDVFSFGATEPLNFRRYVLHENKIHLIDDNNYRLLVQQAAMFASKRIIPETKTIVRITTVDFTLSRQDSQAGWTLDPADDKMSADDKNRLVDAWRNAHGSSVSLLKPSDSVTNQTVSIDFSDNSRLRYRLLRAGQQTFLVNENIGLKFELATDTLQQLRLVDRS